MKKQKIEHIGTKKSSDRIKYPILSLGWVFINDVAAKLKKIKILLTKRASIRRLPIPTIVLFQL